jgi:hypothetical protein
MIAPCLSPISTFSSTGPYQFADTQFVAGSPSLICQFDLFNSRITSSATRFLCSSFKGFHAAGQTQAFAECHRGPKNQISPFVHHGATSLTRQIEQIENKDKGDKSRSISADLS